MSKEKRLIDANALAEHIKDLPTWWADDGGVYGKPMKYPDGMFDCEDVISSIEYAPTVDAVEVVRCRECVHWEKQVDSMQGRCELLQQYPTGGWYCANGERKADE